MKRNEDFRKALGQPDEYFRRSVIDTLDQLNRQAEKESRPQRRYTTRIIASFAALVLAVTGIIFSRQYIPGISPDGHIDAINPTPTVATQLAKSASVVETDLATLSIRNTGIDGNTVYVSVEVMPRKKKSLALNWSLKPYSDSVTKIGKTPDYEGQTVMGWAREHGYEEIIRVVFSNAFEPLTPGIVDASFDQQTGIVPAPAFDSLCINHSEYEDNGATLIYVTGNSLPDTKEYMLGFVLQTWDMTLTDHAIHDFAISIDPQIFGNIPFTIGKPEKPEVIAEYRRASDPENPNITLSLLRTSYSDFYEIRTNNTHDAQEYTGTSIFEYDNGLPVPISVSILPGVEIQPEGDNDPYVFRRACDINDVPEKLSLFLKSGQMQEFILTSSRAGIPTGNSTARKVVPPLEEYSAQAWAVTAESLSDLYENAEARIGQVYCVKGVVENTFLDDHLGRVIINVGENGQYLPVCVESSEDYPFTWKVGSYYRIYADVTSIEGNMPILTARYSFTMSENIAIGTDFATLKVREAKTDGYGVFLQVEVQSKEENTLVVPNSLDIRNDSVRKLGIDERKSIYQWAVDNHYHLLIVDFNSPADTTDNDTDPDRGFHPYWTNPSFGEENGSTVIKAVGYAIPDTAHYELGFSLYSVDQDSSDNPRYNLLETDIIPVTVSETEEPKVIAEYKAVSSLSAEIPTPDATLTLLQSSCSDYCELRSGDTEHVFPDSVHYDFMLSNDFFTEDKLVEWSKQGSSDFVLSYQAIEDDNTFVLRRSWAFPTEIPDKICLSGTSGYFSGLYEKVQ